MLSGVEEHFVWKIVQTKEPEAHGTVLNTSDLFATQAQTLYGFSYINRSELATAAKVFEVS